MDVDHEDGSQKWPLGGPKFLRHGHAVAHQSRGREDGRTLAVDAITGGLIQKWNEEHPEKAPGWATRRQAPSDFWAASFSILDFSCPTRLYNMEITKQVPGVERRAPLATCPLALLPSCLQAWSVCTFSFAWTALNDLSSPLNSVINVY